MRYLGRRLAHAVLLLFATSALTFLLMELAPGDYFSEMRLNPQISPETLQTLREQYGLDRPVPSRFGHWLISVAHGDLGYSFAYNTPVAPILWLHARNTLLLGSLATLLAWGIAVPAGVWSAAREHGVVDRVCGSATTVLLATPDVLLALVFLMLALRLRLPAGGVASVGYEELSRSARAADLLRHVAIPAVVLVLATIPVLIRHVRSAMLEALRAPFITAARAHGIARRRLLFRHALPAAANPLVSLFGLSVAGLLSTSLLVEVIMSWPGLGPLLLEAIFARDLYMVVGAVLLSAAMLVCAGLLADVLLFAADPRIRVE